MKDIVGNMAYFYPHERQLLGLEEPCAPIDEIDMTTHYNRLEARRAYCARRITEITEDFEAYNERVEDLKQLEHDEAMLMDISFDLAPVQAQLAEPLLAREPRDKFTLD